MDNEIIAAVALVAFFAFVVFSYIYREEKNSRKIRSIDSDPGRENIETRSRRAF